jgi:ATP-dependent DNA helicase RecG
MQPAVRPLFTVCEVDGKIVVSAEIPAVELSERPVYYRGVGRVKGSFVRVGEADEPMSDYEIYSYDAYHRRIRDDIRPAELSDISQLRSELLISYAGLKIPKPIPLPCRDKVSKKYSQNILVDS